MSARMTIILLAVGLLASVAHGNLNSGYIPRNVADPVQSLVQQINRMGNVYNLTLTGDKLNVCWKDTITRGVGHAVNSCPKDMQKDAGLCYKPCRDGYDGVGPVCWEQCKPGFTDTGAFCGRSGEIVSANNKNCPWYDMCGLTFEQGCSYCPSSDYTNDGCTCRIDPVTYAKDSYGRGVGTPMGCADDEEYDAGLCYELCPKKYDGVGPVCWQQCPRARPADMGAICCTSDEACNDFVKKVSKATAAAVAAAVEAGRNELEVKQAIKKALEAATSFALLSCERFTVSGRRR